MLKAGSDLPLEDRILKSSSCSFSVPLVFTQHNQRDKYKNWTESRIAKALEAVNSQGLTIRRAAEGFDIPKSTLHDRASGRVLAGATSGPPQYLTDEEEDELEAFLSGAAKPNHDSR